MIVEGSKRSRSTHKANQEEIDSLRLNSKRLADQQTVGRSYAESRKEELFTEKGKSCFKRKERAVIQRIGWWERVVKANGK